MVNIVIFIVTASIFLLGVHTWWDGRYREYRFLISEPKNLLDKRFEIYTPVGQPAECFIQDKEIRWLEKYFALQDVASLERKGIFRQVEYLKYGRVIPRTLEFQKELDEYEERLSRAAQSGKEKLARMVMTAPYEVRHEFYRSTKNTDLVCEHELALT
jgi:hypothetical protein